MQPLAALCPPVPDSVLCLALCVPVRACVCLAGYLAQGRSTSKTPRALGGLWPTGTPKAAGPELVSRVGRAAAAWKRRGAAASVLPRALHLTLLLQLTLLSSRKATFLPRRY